MAARHACMLFGPHGRVQEHSRRRPDMHGCPVKPFKWVQDHNKRRRKLFMPSRLLDWPPATVQKAGRDPGTSKERQPSRLVPRQGQGPGLRDQGGQHIDQYLMRLLHVGVQNAMQDFILGPEVGLVGAS